MKAIWKLDLDYGRDGDLQGIFVAEKEDLDAIDGKTLYFGDALGWHSNITKVLNLSKDIKKVTDNAEAVAIFEKYDMEIGYNPLAYLEPE